MNKRLLSALAAVSLLPALAHSAPARPTPFVVEQPDGTEILVRQIGDESALIMVDHATGVPVKDFGGTYFYLKVENDGTTASSGIKAKPFDRLSSNELQIIKGLSDSYKLQAYLKATEEETGLAMPMKKTFPGNPGQMSKLPVQCTGIVHTPVILIEFSDLPFTKATKEDFEEQLNGRDVKDKEYAKDGSVAQYYYEQSGGQFLPVFDVYGPVKLEKTHAEYYKSNFGNSQWASACVMLADACALLDGQIDFTKYDLDGDGFVNHINFIYAGPPEDNNYKYNGVTYKGAVWPHNYDIKYGKRYISEEKLKVEDGTLSLGHYLCCPEISTYRSLASIGTFVHEFGHTLGLPDLYTTNTNKYSEYYNPSADNYFYFTPTYHDLMDIGCYNNYDHTMPSLSVYQKRALGWIEPLEIDRPGEYILDPVSLGGRGLIIHDSNSQAEDFYTFEFRDKTGFDKYFYNYEKRSGGLLSYHVRFSGYNADNAVNNSHNNQKVQLVRADNSRDITGSDWLNDINLDYFGAEIDGYPSVTEFSYETEPALLFGNTSLNPVYDDNDTAHSIVCLENGEELYLTDMYMTEDGRFSIIVNQGDEVIEVGAMKVDYSLWDGVLTGINRIKADSEDAAVEYFNLQGIRVKNPSNGIYIMHKGKTTTKVAL